MRRRSNDALREWAHAEAAKPGRRRVSVNAYKESIPIFTCASILADAIVQMPVRIYDGFDRRTAKEVVGGPAVKLFERPNEVQEQPDFIRTVALQCALGGMTKIRKLGENSRTRLAEQLIPLGAQGATPKRPGSDKYALDGWILANADRSEMNLQPHEVVLVKYADDPDDPLAGVSPVGVARRSIEMGVLGLERNRSLLERDGRKDGGLFYKGQGTLDDDQVAQVQQELDENSGPESAGVVPIFSGDFEYRSFSMSMRDLEWAAAMKLDLEGACRIYRIPPIFAGIYDNAGWAEAGVKTQEKLLYRNAVLPFVARLEQALTLGVLRGFDPKLSVWFDRDAVDALREDINEKLLTAEKLLALGWTQNQTNEHLELGLPETEWGDESFVPAGLTTRNAVIEMSTLPAIDEEPDPAVDPPGNPPTDGKESKEPEDEPDTEPDMESDPAVDDEPDEPDDEQTASLEFPHLTNGQLKQWRMMMRALQPGEKKLLGRIRRNLMKQRAAVLAALRGKSQRAEKKPNPNDVDAAANAFDPEDLASQIIPVIEEIYRTSSVAVIAELSRIGIASDEALEILDTNVPKLASSYREKRMGITVEIGEHIKAAVGKSLAAGYSNGENLSELIGRVQGVFNAGAQRARTIARTEVNSANNNARFEIMKDANVARKEWLCVAGDTRLTGPGVSHVARRWHHGRWAELRTVSGRVVTVTADHKVLTRRGWIAAEDITPGDDLIGYVADVEGPSPRSRVVPDVQDVPPTVDEVFGSLYEVASQSGMVTRVVNLDSEGIESEVEVVLPDRALQDRLQPAQSQFLREVLLKLSDDTLAALADAGVLGQFIIGPVRASGSENGRDASSKVDLAHEGDPNNPSFGLGSQCPAGSLDRLPDDGGRGVPSLCKGQEGSSPLILRPQNQAVTVDVETPRASNGCQLVESTAAGVVALDLDADTTSFRAPTNAHPNPNERLANDSPGTSVPPRKFGDADTAPVLFSYDRCIGVDVVTRSAHAYDYTTATGWMVANGLVIHNSAADEHVRDSHVACAAEGPIPFSSKFSNGLDGPHDPNGPPSEIIACRCVLLGRAPE